MSVPDAAGAADTEEDLSAAGVDVLLARSLDVLTVDCGPELLVCVGPSSPPLAVAWRGIKATAVLGRSSGELPHEPR